jgi:hypothetical protein
MEDRLMFRKWFPTSILISSLLLYTFDPITIAILLKIFGVIAGTAAVASIVILTIDEILNWFKNHRNLAVSDFNNVGVTIKEAMHNGNFVVVQGVFNKRTNSMVASRKIEAKQLDSELMRRHSRERVVEYNIR